jgi:hypothetical protein
MEIIGLFILIPVFSVGFVMVGLFLLYLVGERGILYSFSAFLFAVGIVLVTLRGWIASFLYLVGMIDCGTAELIEGGYFSHTVGGKGGALHLCTEPFLLLLVTTVLGVLFFLFLVKTFKDLKEDVREYLKNKEW